MAPHDPFAALRERNYRLFIFGWLPASMGLQMQAMAIGWEVYERTHDALALGNLGLARALPTVLLALPAGQIVDHVDRRRALVITQLGFAFTGLLLMLGSIAWERRMLGDGQGGVWLMYLLMALTGCARVFNGPSRSSLLPTIIPGGATGPIFHNAVTWNSGVFQLAATLGPIAAGYLIHVSNRAWPVYAASAATCLWFAVNAFRIQPLVRHDTESGDSNMKSMWELVRPATLLPGMLEGVRHMWLERTVLAAITLDLFAVLLGGATALMPVYAKEILDVGPIGLGALKAAPFVGAFLIAVIIAHRPPFRKAGPTLLWSVAMFGICTIVIGISRNFWLSIAALGILGAVDNISVVVRGVLVSVRTPDHLRGRVAAVNSVFIECSNEVGGFESGLVARLCGPVFSVVSGGAGTLLVVLGMAMWFPELRKLGRLQTESKKAEEAIDQTLGPTV